MGVGFGWWKRGLGVGRGLAVKSVEISANLMLEGLSSKDCKKRIQGGGARND